MVTSKVPPAARVPVTPALVKALTFAVKKHLLDNGIEPAIMNDVVIRTALRDYNAALARNGSSVSA